MDGSNSTYEAIPHLAESTPLNATRTWRNRWLSPLRRPFFLLVILPTLAVAAFEYLVAADQYESEAHFIVRGARSAGAGGGGGGALGQMLGLPGGMTAADTHSVADYLQSHDAVAAVQRTIDLPTLFRRPEADPVTRLWSSDPPPETLLKYYRRQVDVVHESETGITKLSVRAFRPADAQQLTESLLALGEARVNALNERALGNALTVAQKQLLEAEAGVTQAQVALTGFRQSHGDIDPERTSAAQITLAASLEQQLALARAQLSSLAASVGTDSPQYIALAGQVRALEAQTAGSRGRLAGQAGAKATELGLYESLRLRQEFAAKRYQAAAAGLEGAREEAMKQQQFIVRVVEPNRPGKALYPERLKIVATVFVGLLLLYGVGWLILAGVREHAS